MTYNNDTGERYSNDNHPEFPYGMKFKLNGKLYMIYRTDDILNQIKVLSKSGGYEYIGLMRLSELFKEGRAVKVEEDES